MKEIEERETYGEERIRGKREVAGGERGGGRETREGET